MIGYLSHLNLERKRDGLTLKLFGKAAAVTHSARERDVWSFLRLGPCSLLSACRHDYGVVLSSSRAIKVIGWPRRLLAVGEIACVRGSTPRPNGEGQTGRSWLFLSGCGRNQHGAPESESHHRGKKLCREAERLRSQAGVRILLRSRSWTSHVPSCNLIHSTDI